MAKILTQKLFFGRFAPFVRFLEGLGLLFAVVVVTRSIREGAWHLEFYLYLLFLFQWLTVRVCYHIPWYPWQERGIGIEVHFAKALVPTSYMACILGILYLSGARLTGVIIANVMMAVMLMVQFILIWFHFRDKGPLPVNYLSLNKYRGKGTVPKRREQSPSLPEAGSR